MKKIMKSKNGISMISLVVTVIVLVMLAAVTGTLVKQNITESIIFNDNIAQKTASNKCRIFMYK